MEKHCYSLTLDAADNVTQYWIQLSKRFFKVYAKESSINFLKVSHKKNYTTTF